MTVLILVCGAGAAVASFGALVWARARRLRQAAAAIATDAILPPGGGATILAARARHEETFFLLAGARVRLDGYAPGLAGELLVTETDLMLRALEDPARTTLVHVPLGRVVLPLLLPATEQGVLLRVDWARGGQRLSTVFAIAGTLREAELVRREIHLRAGRASVPLPTLPPPA